MATVNKDFKIKSGLIVEGTTATVNGNQILTENAGDQYILNLIGGETLVKSVGTNLSVDNAGQLSLDEVGIATDLAGYRLYTDGSTLNVDVEGVADDLINTFGIATTNGVSIALEAYTTTDSLDSTVDGYGYLKSADLTGYATETYADNAADTAESNANTYTDNKIVDSSNATDKVWSAYKTSTEIGLAQQAAEDYADTAVGNIVGAAPELLDTLQELAAALQDNPDVIQNIQDVAAGKQDTLTAGSNIDITGSTISVTGLDTDDVAEGSNLYFTNQRALDATSAAYDASGAAATAEDNANTYTNNAIDALTTVDIPEGTPGGGLYFTDARAIDAIAATINGGTQTNISVSYNTGTQKFDFVAENGVADSTTDDLSEGDNNLYFTDQRVLGAVNGATISPAAVSINDYRKEEATQQGVQNASTVNVHSFSYPYESVKYLVRVVGWVGGTKHSQITEILMTVDGNGNIAMTEYGNVHTSTEPLATFSAVDAGGTFALTATTAVGGCEIIAAATMLSWAD